VFDSIGWGEILVVALAALFIFGPERLPHLAKDAAAGLKRVRAAIRDVRGQVDETLGDDFAELRELDLRRYHPRTFIRDQLFADEDDEDFPTRTGVTDIARPRDRGTPPPYDYDAT
jgi:sec-independent protein translocase protein TatB